MYLSIMSNVPGRAHDNMLRMYGFRGFPSMAILSPGGAKITQPAGRGIKAFQKAYDDAIAKLKEDAEGIKKSEEAVTVKLKAAAEAAAKAAEEAVAFKKMLEETKAKAEKGDKQASADIEIYDTIKKLKSPKSRDEYMSNKKALYELYKAGKKPTFEKTTFEYYSNVVNLCIENKDKENAKKSITNLKEASKTMIKKNPQWTSQINKYIEDLKTKIDKL